jgi:hypothetical protein
MRAGRGSPAGPPFVPMHLRPALPLLLLPLAACDRGPAQPEQELSELGMLQQLGYSDSVDAEDPHRPVGVLVHDAEATAPGLTLITIHRGGESFLLDEAGEVVHRWSLPSKVWGHTQPDRDGSLLVPAIREEGTSLLRLSWDSEVLLDVPTRAHHDAERRADGLLSVLSFAWRELPEFTAGWPDAEVRDELLVVVDDEGTILGEHSMIDLLASDPAVFTFKEVEMRAGQGDRRPQLDLLHANSLYWMRPEDAVHGPLFAEGNVLVSMRHQDQMAIVRPAEGKVLWSWGLGEISGPHDATVLANGHMMIFDNGLEAKRSRALEVDPATGDIVWSWQAPEPGDFFTIARGAAERLPNGNTILVDSDHGHVVEVTAEGRVVWEYYHPAVDGRVASIVRAKRYPREMFPALAGD